MLTPPNSATSSTPAPSASSRTCCAPWARTTSWTSSCSRRVCRPAGTTARTRMAAGKHDLSEWFSINSHCHIACYVLSPQLGMMDNLHYLFAGTTTGTRSPTRRRRSTATCSGSALPRMTSPPWRWWWAADTPDTTSWTRTTSTTSSPGPRSAPSRSRSVGE